MEEWPKAGSFLLESKTPSTPPKIESWSSSSSNDDNSHVVNASISSKKPKKRKIPNRLQTKLNFDECVLTQRKNQQWVTPKVTKTLRQCHDGFDDDEKSVNISQSEDFKEPSTSVVNTVTMFEKLITDSSSSSTGLINGSPGQRSIQDILKGNTSLHRPVKMFDNPSSSSLCQQHGSSLTAGVSIPYYGSSQERDTSISEDVADIESTTQSSPIIKRNKISRFKRKRNKISTSPIIGMKVCSRQKLRITRKKKLANKKSSSENTESSSGIIENTPERRVVSNASSFLQISSPKILNFNSSSSQVENSQFSPIIKSTIARMSKSIVCLSPKVSEKSPEEDKLLRTPTIKNAITDSHNSPSDVDSIVENTQQLSPVIRIKSLGRCSSKRRRNRISSLIDNSTAESPIFASSVNISTASSSLIRGNDVVQTLESKHGPTPPKDLKIQQCPTLITLSNASPTAENNVIHSPSQTWPSIPPNSPIIGLTTSARKSRNRAVKSIRKNRECSLQVTENCGSEVSYSGAQHKSANTVSNVNSLVDTQSDFVENTQLYPVVVSKRSSSVEETDTALKNPTAPKDSSVNTSPIQICSIEDFTATSSGTPLGHGAECTAKIIPRKVLFTDFRVPLPKSSPETQNPSAYKISVDLDTQNFTPLFKKSSVVKPLQKSSNLFSSDSNSMNISFSTQDSIEMIVNSLVPKRGNFANSPEPDTFTIDSFPSQDVSSEAKLNTPVKITTVSDLPSPKSSGYQIVTCSSQSTDRTPPTVEEDACVNMDSAKKKKRLRKGGYAARLQKLLNRQKSASRIFQHEIANSSEKFSDKGMKLHVDEMWHECDKVFLHCSLVTQGFEDDSALLILDPNQCKKIQVNAVINIYPPWYTFTMSKHNAKVLMNVYNLQIISAGDGLQANHTVSTTVIQEFNCRCSSIPIPNSAKCDFKLPLNGLEILELLFPNPASINVPLRIVKPSTSGNSDGTISELFALPSGAFDNYIDICIQRVFHFKELHNPDTWSLLGQDSKGELCEAILPPRLETWPDYSEIILGDVYRVNVVNVTKRIHRNKCPGLWAVIDCKTVPTDLPNTSDMLALTDAEHNIKQLYVYVITVANNQCNVKKLDVICNWARHSWMKPKATDLFDVLNAQPSENYAVFSFRVNVLFVTDSFLYLTDLSLSGTDQSYCSVMLRPSCCVPANLAAQKSGVAFLQDVLLLRGQLSLDKYSRIITSTDQWPAEISQKLVAMKPILADLGPSSLANDLVSVTGNIVGVDEETAFEWMACVECDGNLLTPTPDGSNVCNACNKTVATRLMMSLEILVVMAELVVKIKLQQSRIVELLPPSQNDGEGFELSSVLGKQIGPLGCVVLQGTAGKELAFTLQELPSN